MKSKLPFFLPNWKMIAALFAMIGLLIPSSLNSRASTDDKEITPTVEKAQPSFWSQQYMLGDWGGERTRLEKEGVSFDFNDIGDFLTDVSGSQTHHAPYFAIG